MHTTGHSLTRPPIAQPSSTRPAMPTPANRSVRDLDRFGIDWSQHWRRLRDAVVSPEERVLRAARRGRPVILGTAAEPWESLPERRKLLSCLEGYAGLRLRLTCRSDQVLEDAEILAWLDRDHAVRVEFRLDGRRLVRQGFDSPYVLRLCRAVEQLAARGLETRMVIEPRGAIVVAAGETGLAKALEHLAERLSQAGSTDLLVTDDAPADWRRRVEPLRLAHGFAGAASGAVRLPR